ncbi:hypothetical protein, partial [Kocuria sp. KH4]
MLSLGFPLMALLVPLDHYDRGFRFMVVGFFAVGAVWLLAVVKLPGCTSPPTRRGPRHRSTAAPTRYPGSGGE